MAAKRSNATVLKKLGAIVQRQPDTATPAEKEERIHALEALARSIDARRDKSATPQRTPLNLR